MNRPVFHSTIEHWINLSAIYQFSAQVEGKPVKEVVKDSFTTKINLRNKKVLVTNIKPFDQAFYTN